MALTAHNFPNANQLLMTKTWNLNATDTIVVGLIASGTFNWVAGTYPYATVTDFLNNAGSGGGGALTEVSTSGTGYTRQALTSVSVSTTGLYTTVVAGANPSWAASTISAKYAFFYVGATANTNDATTNRLLAAWDFGGTNTDSNGVYTLVMPTANAVAGALVQITASL